MSPRHQGTLLLVLALVAAWAASEWAGVFDRQAALLEIGAREGGRIFDGEPWRLATSLFLHGGPGHAATNVLGVGLLGWVLEPALGALGLVLLFLYGGLAGNLLSLALAPAHSSVGASGSVYGLAGALLVLLARHRGPFFPGRNGLVVALLGGGLAWSAWRGFSQQDWDAYAHLGGLLAGALAGALASARPSACGPRLGLRWPAAAAALGLLLALALAAWSQRPFVLAEHLATRGDEAWARGDLAGAATLWSRSLALEEDAGRRWALALVLWRLKRPDPALAHLQRALAGPGPGPLLAGPSEAGPARQLLETHLRAHPASAPGHLLLARVLLEEGQALGAEEHLEKALEARPGWPEPLLWQARAEQQQGRPAQARELLARALARRPDWPEARLQMGLLLLQRGDWRGCLGVLSPLQSPQARGHQAAWLWSGWACYQGGRLAEAEARWSRLLEEVPGQAQALFARGHLYWFGRQERQKARADWEEVARGGGDSAEGWALRVQALLYLGRTEEARAAARQGLACHPRSAALLALLGRTAWAEERASEALGWYRRALRADPGDPAVRYDLARLLWWQQEPEACGELARVVVAAPMSLEGRCSLGFLALQQGDVTTAAGQARALLAHLPFEPEPNYLMARVRLRQGRLEEARAYLLRARQAAPWSPEYRQTLESLQ